MRSIARSLEPRGGFLSVPYLKKNSENNDLRVFLSYHISSSMATPFSYGFFYFLLKIIFSFDVLFFKYALCAKSNYVFFCYLRCKLNRGWFIIRVPWVSFNLRHKSLNEFIIFYIIVFGVYLHLKSLFG